MATCSWSATGASLSLGACKNAKSVFVAKTPLHEIPGLDGDRPEVLKAKSELIYATGTIQTLTEWNNFRSSMKGLENAGDATFTCSYPVYSSVPVVVLHGEEESSEEGTIGYGKFMVEMAVRDH
jgi:hypothetical protein